MLVRVVEYGGAWAASVRLADARGRPLEIRHQARVPPALEKDYGLSEAASLGERVAAVRGLAREADLLVADLDARHKHRRRSRRGTPRLPPMRARAFGIGFFDAMERLWQARVTGEPDEEAAALAAAEAVEAARGLSDALASETEALVADSAAIETAHERLGGGGLSRGGMADAVLGAALAVRRTRTLADRVEKEYVLMVRLENDIRNWRQGDLGVRVLDAEGGAVEGAQVEIVQTGHAFLFGCNVFALGRWGDAQEPPVRGAVPAPFQPGDGAGLLVGAGESPRPAGLRGPRRRDGVGRQARPGGRGARAALGRNRADMGSRPGRRRGPVLGRGSHPSAAGALRGACWLVGPGLPGGGGLPRGGGACARGRRSSLVGRGGAGRPVRPHPVGPAAGWAPGGGPVGGGRAAQPSDSRPTSTRASGRRIWCSGIWRRRRRRGFRSA